MEIVQSLVLQSCLDAVHWFIARTGKPKTKFSDNGSKFVGAANELKAVFKDLNQSEMQRNLAQNDILRNSILPAAPHFGDAWKSLVKLSKRAIFNIFGRESLKVENLSTIFCIAEQLPNNRPLTAVISDVEDLQWITMNHFLVGGANVSWPISLSSDNTASNRKMFRHLSEQLKRALWKRWTSKYLPLFQRRAKWRIDSGTDIKVGDYVWMVDEKESHFNYPLARIQKIHGGYDKIARMATSKTVKGSYLRPLVKRV